MAKIKLNPLFGEITGKVGNVVFKKTANGDTIIAKCPDMSRVEWSEAQKAQRERFKLANAYAKAALADPELRAIYEKLAEEKGNGPFAAAKADYFQGNDRLAKK